MHNTLSSDKLLREPLTQHHHNAPSVFHIKSIFPSSLFDGGLKQTANRSEAVSGGCKNARCRELTLCLRRQIRRGCYLVRSLESRAAETRQSPKDREHIPGKTLAESSVTKTVEDQFFMKKFSLSIALALFVKIGRAHV